MRREMRVRADVASAATLAELLEDVTDATDSHPALAERLAALGERATIPDSPDRGAGDVLLDDCMNRVAEHFDAEWQRMHGDEWLARSASDRGARDRLAELETLESQSAADVFERATLLERLDGPDAALPVYQAALEANPQLAGAAFASGRILLERDDAAGAELVERAVAADEELLSEGCAILIPFHRAHGRLVEAERWRRRAARQSVLARIGDVRPG
jgi:hypothetical protein